MPHVRRRSHLPAVPADRPAVSNHQKAIRRGALRAVRPDPPGPATLARRTAPLLPRHLLVRTGPEHSWAPGRVVPQGGAARPRPFCGAGLAQFERARPAARRGLRRWTLSGNDAPARIPSGRPGFLARGGGRFVAPPERAGGGGKPGTGALPPRELRGHHHVAREIGRTSWRDR